jgi:hypothetical protein
MGVVSGLVMAYQFGPASVISARAVPSDGPRAFTASQALLAAPAR